MTDMNVCYVGGCGRLGYPMAVWTASCGYPTAIADINEAGVKAIQEGTYRSPEPDVDGLAAMAHRDGNLFATTDVYEAARNSDTIFVITRTPSLPDGSFSPHDVIAACREIGRGIRDDDRWRVVSVASTVMPGQVEGEIRKALESASGKVAHEDFGLCYTPEFIRQGAIIEDLSTPDFVIVGCETDGEWEAIRSYYKAVTLNDCPIIRMSIPSAEITKMGLNVSVVAKVARANELALLCHYTPGADAEDVLHAIGLDSRISSKYFSPGPPPGGPCFPRDSKAMSVAMRKKGIAPHVTDGVNSQERYLIKRMAWVVTQELDKTGGDTVGILGLTYKPGVPLLVGSPALMLSKEIGMFPPMLHVYAYDPLVSAAEDAGDVVIASSLEELVEASDVLVLMTPHREFLSLSEHNLMDKVVVDMWGFLPHLDCGRYVRFGRGR